LEGKGSCPLPSLHVPPQKSIPSLARPPKHRHVLNQKVHFTLLIHGGREPGLASKESSVLDLPTSVLLLSFGWVWAGA
jgi:hypothetical protein